MTWVAVGVKCVCVNDNVGTLEYAGFKLPSVIPGVGQIYTISGVQPVEGQIGLSFEEIPLRQCAGPIAADVWWYAENFRPLVKRKTDISIFTQLLKTKEMVS